MGLYASSPSIPQGERYLREQHWVCPQLDRAPNGTYLTVLDVRRREFVRQVAPINSVSPAQAGAQFEFRDVTHETWAPACTFGLGGT